jgi:hypothetical protein
VNLESCFLEIVLSFVWEILLQLVGEFFVELGFHSVGDAFRQRSRTHPVLAALGIVILGALGGVVTSVIWPTRLFSHNPVLGLSLLISPALSALVMDRFGRWRESRGHARSYVSTYWGGALFAFAMALVRLLWVGA